MNSGLLFLGAIGAAVAAANLPAKHIPELTDVHKELQAECIAIILDGHPKRSWIALATEYAKDPALCREVMKLPTKTILPMHGGNWRDRLDVGRTAVSP